MGKLTPSELRTWGQRKRISIAQAAYLWVGEQPATDHRVAEKGNAYATFGMLKENIWEKQGKPGRYPKGSDFLPLAEFTRIAEELRERPTFLYLDDVKPVQRKTSGTKQSTIDRLNDIGTEVEHWLEIYPEDRNRAFKMAGERLHEKWGAKIDIRREYRRYLELQKAANRQN